MTSRDPLLNKEFKFYNSYVLLELKEKEKLAGLEILHSLNEMLEEKDLMIKVKSNEVKNQKFMLDLSLKENVDKDEKIRQLELQI